MDLDKITEKPIRIIGVPMDYGASHRGTDMGPSALRIAGVAPKLRKIGYQVQREAEIQVPAMETREARNADARFYDEILTACSELSEAVKTVLEEGGMPLILGGDHSIAMGSVSGVSSYFRQQNKELGLIWFDAHGDMNVPGISPSGNIHGMPLAHLLGYGDDALANIGGFSPKVKPENVALIGIRELDRGERKVIRESGVQTFTMRDIDERGMAAVAAEVVKVVTTGTDGFHLSFDVDGCDPSVIPGSGTLVPGGINFREAHLLLEYCADSKMMTSMDVVELNPALDIRNQSAETAVQLLLSAFGKSIL
ncbi:MAG: arginase [Planctomycetes bacterium]|nr:arginase [Planctomycetota bacterium]